MSLFVVSVVIGEDTQHLLPPPPYHPPTPDTATKRVKGFRIGGNLAVLGLGVAILAIAIDYFN